MGLLREENFFNGSGKNDPALSARDRISRAPKSFGFVILSPAIRLTPAGLALISAKRKDEIFLRQLLKFQIPSPYHKPTVKSIEFRVKPYLELFRLIRQLGSLRFDELRIFGLQLVDYRKFDDIVSKINAFRVAKAQNEGRYKKFCVECLEMELRSIYANDIASGNVKTRESSVSSIAKFLTTKARNMRDYADACLRYLRATGLVNISHVGKSISIAPEKMQDVDFFLEHTDKEPKFTDDEEQYVDYLGEVETPALLTDDRKLLEQKIKREFPAVKINESMTLEHLKDIFTNGLEKRKAQLLADQITAIKDYRLFDEINITFEQILGKSIYDAPLIFEWNTWRAMTMLDGGKIKANLKFDDFGNPLSPALGNMADIVCDYGDFCLAVEVTMQSGQRQFEAEGESVIRHLARLKKETNKPAYCLFVAPVINKSCIAYFYSLHKANIDYYGGTSIIVPLPLNVFLKMLGDSYKASYVPEPKHVQRLFEYSNTLADTVDNETEWHNRVIQAALSWLNGYPA